MWHSALRVVGALVLLQQLHGLQLPSPQGYVNDFANVIPADSRQTIQRIIDDVRAKSGGEIVVVTLPDIGQNDPNTVTLQIGRTWKVGKFGKPGDQTRNTGVVILVVPKETSSDGHGHCYIGVGYGAEGFITDATSGTICRAATPLFMQKAYGPPSSRLRCRWRSTTRRISTSRWTPLSGHRPRRVALAAGTPAS